MKFNTALLHCSCPCDPQTGATLTPIYQVTYTLIVRKQED